MLAEVCSGNQSDMTWNGRWLKGVREQLGLLEDKALVYVADSALVTADNLQALAEAGLDFISRLPERFGLAAELMGKVLKARSEWEAVGALVEGEQAARYQLWEAEEELEGRGYRFLVIHSSSLDERRLRALERRVAKEAQEKSEALAALAKLSFVCAPDAQRAWERFRQEQSSAWHRWEGQVRQALAQPEEKPVEGLNRQLTKKPTSYAIQSALSAILVVGLRRRGQLELRPSGSLSRNQRRLLRLAGFDAGLYQWRGKTPRLIPSTRRVRERNV